MTTSLFPPTFVLTAALCCCPTIKSARRSPPDTPGSTMRAPPTWSTPRACQPHHSAPINNQACRDFCLPDSESTRGHRLNAYCFGDLTLFLFSRLLQRKVAVKTGGRGGIRTHERVTPSPDFESGTFNHSATLPRKIEAGLGYGHFPSWASYNNAFPTWRLRSPNKGAEFGARSMREKLNDQMRWRPGSLGE